VTLEAPARAWQTQAEVLENVLLARGTYRIRLHAPSIAHAILPGQFLMLRPGRSNDPLLGRPFAVYDAEGPAIDVVYLVVGRGTAALAEARPGDRLSAWGPLGNGFGPAPEPAGPVVFAAGGIGQTPFLALAKWWLGTATYGGRDAGPGRATAATMLYGVRTAALAAGVEDFQRAGVAVELATDDGTAGRRGFVTDLLSDRLERGERPAKVVGCGPPMMLAALAKLAGRHGLDCDVSLENHMACGFGACFSCVAPVRQGDGSIDLRRVCVDGPVFTSGEVAW
jgi:dihydroorotate dehydrogenase electron transfer subunit